MQIKIHAVGFHADRKLIQYIQKRAEKLLHYFSDLKSCDVYLKVDSAGKPGNKIVEIKLRAPRKDLFAKEQSSTFEEAVDRSVHALEKQVLKFKSKIRRGM
jgi:putative sigma-54 modulation protein